MRVEPIPSDKIEKLMEGEEVTVGDDLKLIPPFDPKP